MLRSMTGIGIGRGRAGRCRADVTLSSVNHKGLDISVRLEGTADIALERSVSRFLSERIDRGRLRADIRLAHEEAAPALHVDRDRARAVWSGLNELAEALSLPERPTLQDVLRFSDVLTWRAPPVSSDETHEAVTVALSEAYAAFDHARQGEGGRTGEALRAHLVTARRLVVALEQSLPEALAIEAAKAAEASSVPPGGLRGDPREELDRIRMHLDALEQSAHRGGVVGERLGFLAQELQREANTLTSKCTAAADTHRAIDLKQEVVRIREHVRNLE